MCMKEDNPGPNLFKGDKLDNNKFKIDCTRLLKVINLLKRYWL